MKEATWIDFRHGDKQQTDYKVCKTRIKKLPAAESPEVF